MNRRLLDPFQSVQLPEVIEEYLEHGTTTCVAFNRRGTLLAAGTQEGQVVLWDFETRGVARVLERHSVASLSWSRNGRYLASVAADKLLVLWDVAQGRPACEAALPCAGSSVSLSPRPPYHCLVSLVEGAPLMLDMQARQERRLPLIGEAELGGKASTKAEQGGGAVSPGAVALFHPSGSTLVVGQARGGALLLLDRDSLMFLDVIKLPNTARVLTLTFNRKGDLLLLNCHDRTLRLFEFSQPAQPAGGPAGAGSGGLSEAAVLQLLANANVKAVKPGSLLFPGPTAAPSTRPVVTPLREFLHAVERCAWVGTAFSADCEHVVAGAVSKTNHHIYIWSRLYGKMERILEGPKERLAGLAWHPLRSCLASLGSPSGRILLWARSYAENWSAFAPDFKELDENVEYVEREDEFDWATPGAGGQHDQLVAREQQSLEVGSASGPTTTTTTTTAAAGLNGLGTASTAVNGCGGGGSEEVDVVTVEEEAVFSSDSEGEQEGGQEAYLHHLRWKRTLPGQRQCNCQEQTAQSLMDWTLRTA
ncbi:WD40-repeat-containing domain protein [Haematococcus lacustris]